MGIMERSERNRRRLLLPHLPTMLLTSRRINLQANATGVNLHAIDPHFYNLAIRLIQLFTIVGRVAVHFNNPFPSHAAELRDFIRYMLHRRFALSLIPRAPEHIARLGPVSTTEFAEALDTLERSSTFCFSIMLAMLPFFKAPTCTVCPETSASRRTSTKYTF